MLVRLSGLESFFVTVVHGLPQCVGAILIDLVVVACPLIAIDGSGVEIRITIIVVAIVLERYPLLPLAL